MIKRSLFYRKTINLAVTAASIMTVGLALLFMGWILYTVFDNGFRSFSWAFFTEPTKPYGIPDGGVANAVLGTIFITLGAVVIGVPPGLLGGIYLAEFAKGNKLGNVIRFSANVMMGIPSIIVGLFVYALMVYTTKTFSGLAGSVALSIIMFPVVLRTTEDMLLMVPDALRESALALGAPRWKTTVNIVCRAAKTGLTTGVLLAVARVSGETAPLLFTALCSDSWPFGYFTQPTSNLTITITEYATNSPFPEMHTRAWGAALIITAAILILNISCRFLFKDSRHGK